MFYYEIFKYCKYLCFFSNKFILNKVFKKKKNVAALRIGYELNIRVADNILAL